MRIQLVVFDGCDALDVAGSLQVFSIARSLGGDFDLVLVSLEGMRLVTAGCGLKFASSGTLGEPVPDMAIVPGGGWLGRPDTGAWAQVKQGALPEVLKALHTQGIPLAAIGTGGMVLAFSGLLKERRATTHRAAIEDLRVTGAHVLQADVVDDNDLLTSSGAFAGVHLALRIVERQAGAGFSQLVSTQLDYNHRPTVL